ncbi:DNA polymerase III subunit chi [Pseudomonas eucalypticola]|uniref:DNA polymerase III subunit chi n=1 Tax=Pseudomonas eucalypticola TaxID=2599595 RepID=A0A7D5D5J2_9PSED|nr:DNA polymerase III subunit chi [Pseudomonas eucalypticola]QKZ03212.1 DNA polymerase III subunit chi [Pseudomonas eucalypticola]
MDTAKKMPRSAHLLDDLESIRKLLGDDTLQPPLLTETVVSDEQIPLLFDQLEAQTQAEAAAIKPAPEPATPAQNRQDTLLHLDAELRAAAQLIMQDVIDDFAPHIETEIKRRLEARMERLLQQP